MVFTWYQDGVCRLDLRSYSKCVEFSDTNYQLAQPDDRTATFEYLCDLYNYVDASTQGDTLAGFRLPSCNRPALDALGDGFLSVGFTQRLAPGKPLLAGGAERHKFPPLDFIALPLHEPQEVVKILCLGDSGVDGDFQLRFPTPASPLGVPLGVGLAPVPARLHHG